MIYLDQLLLTGVLIFKGGGEGGLIQKYEISERASYSKKLIPKLFLRVKAKSKFAMAVLVIESLIFIVYLKF